MSRRHVCIVHSMITLFAGFKIFTHLATPPSSEDWLGLTAIAFICIWTLGMVMYMTQLLLHIIVCCVVTILTK